MANRALSTLKCDHGVSINNITSSRYLMTIRYASMCLILVPMELLFLQRSAVYLLHSGIPLNSSLQDVHDQSMGLQSIPLSRFRCMNPMAFLLTLLPLLSVLPLKPGSYSHAQWDGEWSY